MIFYLDKFIWLFFTKRSRSYNNWFLFWNLYEITSLRLKLYIQQHSCLWLSQAEIHTLRNRLSGDNVIFCWTPSWQECKNHVLCRAWHRHYLWVGLGSLSKVVKLLRGESFTRGKKTRNFREYLSRIPDYNPFKINLHVWS